jgi:CRISPR/Cas system-associated exonuclease Cas4 (RecB family)
MKVSYSKLGAFAFCPKKYEFRYELDVPVPAKPELAFGVSLHAALEDNFRQKIASRRDMPLEEARAVFRAHLARQLSGVPEEALRGPADPLYLRSMGEQFLATFLTERAPGLQPVPHGVEGFFRLPLPGGHEISGKFDLLDAEGVLHDFKTSNKPYDSARADRTQLVIYAWACEQAFGRLPARLCFDVFVKGDGADAPVGLQEPVYFPVPSREEIGRVASVLSRHIETVARARATGHFPRAFQPPRCRWCEYQTPCLREWEDAGRPDPVRAPLERL